MGRGDISVSSGKHVVNHVLKRGPENENLAQVLYLGTPTDHQKKNNWNTFDNCLTIHASYMEPRFLSFFFLSLSLSLWKSIHTPTRLYCPSYKFKSWIVFASNSTDHSLNTTFTHCVSPGSLILKKMSKLWKSPRPGVTAVWSDEHLLQSAWLLQVVCNLHFIYAPRASTLTQCKLSLFIYLLAHNKENQKWKNLFLSLALFSLSNYPIASLTYETVIMKTVDHALMCSREVGNIFHKQHPEWVDKNTL